MEREKEPIAEKDEHGRYIHMEIIPNTYTFPGDYNIWFDEFRRLEKSTWIMKPASGC